MGPCHWARNTQFPQVARVVAVVALGTPFPPKFDALGESVTIPVVVYDLNCVTHAPSICYTILCSTFDVDAGREDDPDRIF